MPISVDLNEFYNRLPKEGITCEIGVYKGGSAWTLYQAVKPHTLYLIDPYVPYGGHAILTNDNECIDARKSAHRQFADCHNVIFIEKTSKDASYDFPAFFFDIVYIDGDHSYDAVMDDLITYYDKIKVGGWLTGHDYKSASHLQVKEAVDDFLKERNLQLDFITNEEWPRWALNIR